MGYVTTLLFILCCVIIICILKYTMQSYSSKHMKFVLINARKTQSIEQTVRYVLKKYPDREIYVINKSTNSEMSSILQKLDKDFERVHIINYNV